jgi:excisionase family DNA binding protein
MATKRELEDRTMGICDDLALDDLVGEVERRRTGDGVMRMLTADDALLASVSTADLAAEIVRRIAALAAPNGSPGATADADPQLLTAPEVAARLGVPVASIYELVRRKKIGCVRLGVGSRSGKQRRFKISPAQLRAFVSSRSAGAA